MDSGKKALDALEAADAALDRDDFPRPLRAEGKSVWFPDGDAAATGARNVETAALIALSVNLSAPLAAVVRAVADRPWWRRTNGEEYSFFCIDCHQELEHSKLCPFADADAALDAFNAAAQEMFP